MEEDFEEEREIDTGKGNPFLSKVCDALFFKTGQIGFYTLGERLSEPEQVFDENLSYELLQEESNQ